MVSTVSDSTEDQAGLQLDPDDLSQEELDAIRDPNNAANPHAIRAKEKAQRRAAKERAALDARIHLYLRGSMQYQEGREFLTWLLFDVAGLMRQPVNVEMDTNRMLFAQGARGVALALQAMAVRADADTYAAMLAERLKTDAV